MEKWYIIQTRPRWEKKVTESLDQKGIESYCPVRRVRRKWSDRMKTLEEPLFKSCVFVKITREQKTEVRLVDGVVNFMYQNGKAVQVKERELLGFRKSLAIIETAGGMLTEDEKEGGKQLNSYQRYLDDFSQWMAACTERPKLF
jgi:transcription antitermination factor NusG